MDFNDAFEQAKNKTEIVKARKNLLFTFGPTKLPYICLCDTEDGVVYIRSGEVTTDKPHISIPGQEAGFEGFEMEEFSDKGMLPIMLARGIHIPPAKYVNNQEKKRVFRGEIGRAIDEELERLEKENDIKTAVIRAPESLWKLSVLIYITTQVTRSAQANISEHMEHNFRQNRNT